MIRASPGALIHAKRFADARVQLQAAEAIEKKTPNSIRRELLDSVRWRLDQADRTL